MKNPRDMSAEELAAELVILANSEPSSGNLRKFTAALDAYKGRGAMLDESLGDFHDATSRFIYVVQRGHRGTPEWADMSAAAHRIAPVLEILGGMEK